MRQPVGGNSDSMKRLNRSTVLHAIHRYKPISKAELVPITKLTFATVSNIVQELMESEWIVEAGYGQSSGGRKPILYQLADERYHVISVDIAVASTTAALINVSGEVVYAESEHHVRKEDGTFQVDLGTIYELVDSVFEKTLPNKQEVIGIGIASPGPLHAEKGVLLSPPNLTGLDGVEIRDLLKTRYGVEARLEKDADAAALGEYWFANRKPNMLYVFADRGTGGGILFNGSIYRGFLNGAGELGHATVDIHGPICRCGNIGCLELYASGIALERNRPSMLMDAIMQEARNGNEVLQKELETVTSYLATGITNAVNMLNPAEVILGGALINGYPPMAESVKNIISERCFTRENGVPDISVSVFQDHAPLIGAAAVILQHVFEHPEQFIRQPK
ncbi:ROK family transcriptional regulator [Radiobacillus deserti]|uniref:ROK family transcriptional regulator n=1 Tax=Radiobacillus deserti TaxID=2594883 RepID=A0A516KKU6_9BACI|nr:ROK family transcriptional regulator [Radiobacillus deserti]QDP41998.1 ROK family transcriptional regulator [Radiobacillus deserti]